MIGFPPYGDESLKFGALKFQLALMNLGFHDTLSENNMLKYGPIMTIQHCNITHNI
jgi:hypothetical protein